MIDGHHGGTTTSTRRQKHAATGDIHRKAQTIVRSRSHHVRCWPAMSKSLAGGADRGAPKMRSMTSTTFWASLVLSALVTAGCGADPAPTNEQESDLTLPGGIDYAWSHPSPTSIRASGYGFAARYLSYDTIGKNLSSGEATLIVGRGRRRGRGVGADRGRRAQRLRARRLGCRGRERAGQRRRDPARPSDLLRDRLRRDVRPAGRDRRVLRRRRLGDRPRPHRRVRRLLPGDAAVRRRQDHLGLADLRVVGRPVGRTRAATPGAERDQRRRTRETAATSIRPRPPTMGSGTRSRSAATAAPRPKITTLRSSAASASITRATAATARAPAARRPRRTTPRSSAATASITRPTAGSAPAPAARRARPRTRRSSAARASITRPTAGSARAPVAPRRRPTTPRSSAAAASTTRRAAASARAPVAPRRRPTTPRSSAAAASTTRRAAGPAREPAALRRRPTPAAHRARAARCTSASEPAGSPAALETRHARPRCHQLMTEAVAIDEVAVAVLEEIRHAARVSMSFGSLSQVAVGWNAALSVAATRSRSLALAASPGFWGSVLEACRSRRTSSSDVAGRSLPVEKLAVGANQPHITALRGPNAAEVVEAVNVVSVAAALSGPGCPIPVKNDL